MEKGVCIVVEDIVQDQRIARGTLRRWSQVCRVWSEKEGLSYAEAVKVERGYVGVEEREDGVEEQQVLQDRNRGKCVGVRERKRQGCWGSLPWS